MELDDLVKDWHHNAARKFEDAKFEKTGHGRRALEHAAMCYFNCAQELKKVLASSPRPSASP